MKYLTSRTKHNIRMSWIPCVVFLVCVVVYFEDPHVVPNVYDAFMVFVEAINPFNVDWGIDHGTPADFSPQKINHD